MKDRHCAHEAIRVERVACRRAREGSLEAIVWLGAAQLGGEVVVLLMSFCRFHDGAFQSGGCHWSKLILSWHMELVDFVDEFWDFYTDNYEELFHDYDESWWLHVLFLQKDDIQSSYFRMG